MTTNDESDTSFSQDMRHRLVEDFAVAYLNGSMKPNLAEKNPTNGRDIEYLMDGPQFERINRSELWSYSNATGTGYQYRVTYRDKRFSDLDNLLGVYTGRGTIPGDDGNNMVDQRLYELVLLLIKEGRLPKSFKIQSAKDPRLDKIIAMTEQLKVSLDLLDAKVKRIEEQLRIEDNASVSVDVQTAS